VEPIELYANLYSPRWGHEDQYTFVFNMERLTITHGARSCNAVWRSDADPVWSGEDLVQMMQNDGIYPPHGMVDFIEALWKAWRDGRLNNDQPQDELTALAEYINVSTRSLPQTDFWRGIF